MLKWKYTSRKHLNVCVNPDAKEIVIRLDRVKDFIKKPLLSQIIIFVKPKEDFREIAKVFLNYGGLEYDTDAEKFCTSLAKALKEKRWEDEQIPNNKLEGQVYKQAMMN